MVSKIVVFDREAKEKILSGIDKLEKATSVTLGPNGKTVIIDSGNRIHATKDGVSVARSVILKDPIENIGVKAIQEVAEKSNRNSGDGTTTSTLLAATIYRNGLKHSLLGANPTMIKRGIDKAAKFVVEHVKKMSTPISEKEDIKKVATVSANGDEEIGEIISDVMFKLGPYGEIKVEDGKSSEIQAKIVEGMTINRGYLSPYFVTNLEKMEVDFQNPLVLITEKKLQNIQQIVPILNMAAKSARPLLIIADDVDTEVLSALVLNKLKGALNVVVIRAPEFSEYRKAILQDISILTFGKVIADDTGVTFEQAATDETIIGEAERVIVTNNQTTIIGGQDTKDAIEERVSQLKVLLDSTEDEYDKKKIQQRIAKLSSGVGIISVGAHTEAELREKRDRVDDAFYASRCAVKSGVVAGGGVTLLNAMKELSSELDNPKTLNLTGDENLGASILCKSLESPIRKILENAGIDSSLIVQNILNNENIGYGFNALTCQYENLLTSGILDATEVVTNEVSNAASVAGTLLTTECVIVDDPDEVKKQQIQPQMPMM